MGLVYGHQRQRHGFKTADEFRFHHAFRRHVQQVQFTIVQASQHRPGFIFFQGGVVHGGTDAIGQQGIDLVFHQRNQW
jgi:hypothetical protein